MHTLIQHIEKTLREDYPVGFGQVFLGSVPNHQLPLADFKAQIEFELPELFGDYYEWLGKVKFDKNADLEDSLEDTEHRTASLQIILRDTQMWQGIQQKQPDREWKTGFVALVSWNSCYQMVIDTLGKIGKKGSIWYWDFKGGSEYYLKYENFEQFLEIKYRLLKEKLYFPPHYSEEEAYDDFMYGDTSSKIEEIVREINPQFKKRVNFAK